MIMDPDTSHTICCGWRKLLGLNNRPKLPDLPHEGIGLAPIPSPQEVQRTALRIDQETNVEAQLILRWALWRMTWDSCSSRMKETF